jgi:hypothetical protein
VFLSLLKFLGVSVFVSAIERSLLALEHTLALCCIVCASTLDKLQLHVSAHETKTDTRAQYALTINRTSVTIKCTSVLLHSCTLMLDRTLPALERISAVSTNKPEAAK